MLGLRTRPRFLKLAIIIGFFHPIVLIHFAHVIIIMHQNISDLNLLGLISIIDPIFFCAIHTRSSTQLPNPYSHFITEVLSTTFCTLYFSIFALSYLMTWHLLIFHNLKWRMTIVFIFKVLWYSWFSRVISILGKIKLKMQLTYNIYIR